LNMNYQAQVDENPSPIYSIDQSLEKAGGFGRFQWLMLIYVAIAYQGTSFFISNLAYLELIPRLECKQEDGYKEWTVDDICKNQQMIDKTLWRPDFTDSQSFHNWMTEDELYWESSFKIGLFGSLIFVGFAINGIIMKQADKFGRKIIIFYGCIGQFICCIGLLSTNIVNVKYFLIFWSGLLISK